MGGVTELGPPAGRAAAASGWGVTVLGGTARRVGAGREWVGAGRSHREGPAAGIAGGSGPGGAALSWRAVERREADSDAGWGGPEQDPGGGERDRGPPAKT